MTNSSVPAPSARWPRRRGHQRGRCRAPTPGVRLCPRGAGQLQHPLRVLQQCPRVARLAGAAGPCNHGCCMRGHLTHARHNAHPISLFKGLASSVPRRPPRSRPGATSPRFRQKRTAHTKPTANHPTEAPPGASDSRSTTDGCGRYVAPTCRRWDRGTLKPKTDAFCGSGRPQSASGSQRPVQGGAPRSLREISYKSPRSALYSLAERAATRNGFDSCVGIQEHGRWVTLACSRASLAGFDATSTTLLGAEDRREIDAQRQFRALRRRHP